MSKVLAYIGREPAQVAAVLTALIELVSALGFSLTVAQQGGLNSAATLLIGLLTAWSVSGEKAAPLLAGVVQAAMSCALSFGLLLSPEVQSAVMTFVAAAVAMWVRGIVHAPVPAGSVRRGGAHSLRS